MRYPDQSVYVARDSRVTILGSVTLPVEFGRAAFDFFTKHRGMRPNLGLNDFIDLFEQAVIFESLSRARGGQKQAAKFLGLKKTTLNMKIKRHNVRVSTRPL